MVGAGGGAGTNEACLKSNPGLVSTDWLYYSHSLTLTAHTTHTRDSHTHSHSLALTHSSHLASYSPPIHSLTHEDAVSLLEAE